MLSTIIPSLMSKRLKPDIGFLLYPTLFTHNAGIGIVQFDVKSGQVETNLITALGCLEKLAYENVSLSSEPALRCLPFFEENLYREKFLPKRVGYHHIYLV